MGENELLQSFLDFLCATRDSGSVDKNAVNCKKMIRRISKEIQEALRKQEIQLMDSVERIAKAEKEVLGKIIADTKNDLAANGGIDSDEVASKREDCSELVLTFCDTETLVNNFLSSKSLLENFQKTLESAKATQSWCLTQVREAVSAEAQKMSQKLSSYNAEESKVDCEENDDSELYVGVANRGAVDVSDLVSEIGPKGGENAGYRYVPKLNERQESLRNSSCEDILMQAKELISSQSRELEFSEKIQSLLEHVANGFADPESMYLLAKCHRQKKLSTASPQEAFRWYFQAAKLKHGGAMSGVAWCYQTGFGVEMDSQQAVYWYANAANSGVDSALYNAAFCYETLVKDVDKAIDYYTQAALKDDANSMYRLGQLYCSGSLSPSNAEIGADWLIQASYLEHADATALLGNCFLTGQGRAKDIVRALGLFKKAAKLKSPLGLYYLGMSYLRGIAGNKNFSAALQNLQESAQLGHTDALVSLGNMYSKGQGARMDINRAISLWTQAVDLGNFSGAFNLGMLFQSGRGIKKDLKSAIKYFTIAAEHGDSKAMDELGYAYKNGHGTQKDLEASFRWFLKAAEAGNRKSFLNVAQCYQDGNGTTRNYQEAKLWYEKCKDDPRSFLGMGRVYLGEGNGKLAQEYLEKAAASGDHRAMGLLAKMYAAGNGVKKDPFKAKFWFQEAAKNGDKKVGAVEPSTNQMYLL